MLVCRRLPVLLSIGLAFAIIGCSSPSVTSLQISPASETLAAGDTAQFTATATLNQGTHAASQQNVTSTVTWASSNPGVATISASGMTTAVAAGATVITASTAGFPGQISASAQVTVIAAPGGTTSPTLVSLSIIPNSQTVASPNETTQFIAIGTTSSGATVNLTNQVTWSSSSAQIATIGRTGLATAVGQGTATITAIYTNLSGGAVVTGTGTFIVAGGTKEQFTAVTVTPTSLALSASGQTSQLIALATSGSTGLQQNATDSTQIQWSSSVPSIASVNASGLVTGLSAGTTTITALLTNADGSVVSNTATVTVSITAAPEPLLSLSIIPSSITVGNLQDTGQFLAIGTFSTPPYVRDLTNSPMLTWTSDAPSVFPVDTNSGGNSGATAGLVTAYGAGSATIIAEATASDGTVQTATSTFTCPVPSDPPQPGQCYQGSQAPALLATLTVYNEGLNNTNWLVTANSATGTPNVLHCGPGSTSGGSVCVATYPFGTSVILTATGGAFGGWSYNCTPTDVNGVPLAPPATPTASGPNYCKITFDNPTTNTNSGNTNVTVGAIFN
jgi:hypothetical protein